MEDKVCRQEILKQHIANIRKRSRQKNIIDKTPEVPCCKCGADAWYKDIQDWSWYCFKCGARGYWQGGVFCQGVHHG